MNAAYTDVTLLWSEGSGVSSRDGSQQGAWGARPSSQGALVSQLPWRLWLGSRGSGLVIKAGGLPLLPDSTSNGVTSSLHAGGGRKPHISASGSCHPTAPLSSAGMFVKYLHCAHAAAQTTYSPAENRSVTLSGICGHLMCKSLSSLRSTQTSRNAVSDHSPATSERQRSHSIPFHTQENSDTEAVSVPLSKTYKSSAREGIWTLG